MLTTNYCSSDAWSYRSESGLSDASFADSPSTFSRAQEIRRRGAARSGQVSQVERHTTTSMYTSGSTHDSLGARSRTPTGTYTGSYAE